MLKPSKLLFILSIYFLLPLSNLKYLLNFDITSSQIICYCNLLVVRVFLTYALITNTSLLFTQPNVSSLGIVMYILVIDVCILLVEFIFLVMCNLIRMNFLFANYFILLLHFLMLHLSIVPMDFLHFFLSLFPVMFPLK